MTTELAGAHRTTRRDRRSRRTVVVGLAVILGQLLVPVGGPYPASASTPTLPFCRSTDGTGATEEATATLNGSYTSLDSRDSDARSGLKIEPVFSKRLYTDLSRGFDAAYIAYRITNSSGPALSDVWVSLTGFGGGPVQLVNPADAAQQIPSLAPGASITRYFLVRSSGTTEADVFHDVRIHQGLAPAGTQLAGCRTAIKGVQRSIAANPNRVTAIRVIGTPTLGQTVTVEVDGAFGNVGQGSGPDGSIAALTPASSSRWPTRALRLESSKIEIRGIQSANAENACVAAGGTKTGSGNTRIVEYHDTLVVRNLNACVTNTKQVYTATYTFRIIGGATTDAVIRPIASISSGTQIKYTGSFPSAEVSIAVSDVEVPITVTKSYVENSATTVGATPNHVRVQYRLVATSTSGEVTLDALLDQPPTDALFISATVTDKGRTGAVISKDEVTESGVLRWRFRGPFTAVAGTPGTPVTLTYTVDLPLPAADQTASYDNFGFAVIGTTVVADGATIRGIQVTTTSDGTVTIEPLQQDRPKDSQTIVFTAPPEVGSGSSTTLGGYSDSGLPLSYTVDPASSSICSVSQFDGVWTLVALAEGTCTVVASQAGDDEFAAATPVSVDILVRRGQTITATNDSTFGSGSSRTVTVVADSLLPVSLASINTEVCTVTVQTAYDSGSGVTVYLATKGSVAGTCLLVASQSGGVSGEVTWGPAPDLEILIGSGTAQTITFANPAGDDSSVTPSVAGDATLDAVATSSANASLTSTNQLPIEFTSLTPAVCGITSAGVDGDGAPLSGMNTTTGVTTRGIELRGAGTCTIRATQDGTADTGEPSTFAPATPVSRTFTVLATGSDPQAIAFDALDDRIYGDTGVTVTASSRKPDGTETGLRVEFTVTTASICAVSSSTLTSGASTATIAILRTGVCTIVAEQPGDLTYATAATVTQAFTITPKPLTVEDLVATGRIYDATANVTVSGTPRLVGVVPGDGPTAIAVTGSAAGTVDNGGDVGEGLEVAVSGLTLTGTRTADYTLTQPTLSVDITQRPITITADDATVGRNAVFACTVSVTSGALQGADALGAVTCTPTASGGTAGTETITVTSVAIGRGGDSVVENYAVTLATGTLTVTALVIPVLTAPAIDVVYGTDVSDVLGVLNAAGGVAAVSGEMSVDGELTHTLGGQAFGVLDAGSYTLSVTFTPTDGSTYATASTTRLVTVRQRDLTISGLSATDRVYDGTSIVTITGTPTLIGRTGGLGDGVLAADAADAARLSLAGGTGSGSVADASAADDRDVTLTGLTLAGTKAANYTLTLPSLTVDIAKRPLTISVSPASAVKLAGATEPTYSVEYSGFASGEDEQVLTGAVTVTRDAGDTAGRYDVTTTGGVNANYAIEREVGALFVVLLAIDASAVADRQVVCECEGLQPGSTATLTIFSAPTVITTVTVDGNGECPGLAGAIPTSVPDGDHTLRLDGVAPDADATPVSLLLPVRLVTPVVNGSGPDAPPTSEDPVTTSEPSPRLSPLAPRTPSEPDATPSNEPPPVVRPFPAPADASPSVPVVSNTLDLGGRGTAASGLSPTASFREVLAVSRQAAVRQLTDLAGEVLGGFAPGSGLRVEVIGARTTARFVVSATERVDAVVLTEALRRSAPAQEADFAAIGSVAPAPEPRRPAPWSVDERAAADDLFAASRLATPRSLADLDVPSDATWLRIQMRASTYLPGSWVHLTVTSDPIVLASAVVGQDGRAIITGDLPVEILAAGEHRIRVVGIRVFDGIVTDAAGEVIVPDEVLREIERFDLGTDATIRIVGDNGSGGTHTAIRVVPLDPTPPWWTLWIVAVTWATVVVLRRRGRLEGRRGRLIGAMTVLVSGVPAVVLGWIATTTQVVWWGIGLAVLASGLASAIEPRSADADVDDVQAYEPEIAHR